MAKAAACLTTNPVITVSDLNTTVNCEPRVLDLRLADALGFTKRYDIRTLIRRHLETLKSFGEVCAIRNKPSAQGGRPGTDYFLNKRQALFITAKSDTERAALVTVQMVEVFDAVTGGRAAALPAPGGKMPVRAYDRAPRKSSLFDGSQSGRGCVVLDEVVYFDARRVPEAGEKALVLLHGSRLGVVTVAESATSTERGFVYFEEADQPKGRRVFSKVPLIGAVTTPAGRVAMPK